MYPDIVWFIDECRFSKNNRGIIENRLGTAPAQLTGGHARCLR